MNQAERTAATNIADVLKLVLAPVPEDGIVLPIPRDFRRLSAVYRCAAANGKEARTCKKYLAGEGGVCFYMREESSIKFCAAGGVI